MIDALAWSILDTWFGASLNDSGSARARNALWFRGSTQFDDLLRARYADVPDRMRAGEFDDWLDDPLAALARVIALDQFPRNTFRGTARAFAYDVLALRTALDAVDRGHDRRLHPLQAVFIYMPFEHAEDAAMQSRAVGHFECLRWHAPDDLADIFDGYLDYARRHAEVIGRFGRFPHRNPILGRDSTPAETAYLEGGGQRF